MKKISDLDYYLIDSTNPKDSEVALLERAFVFWKESWEHTFLPARVGWSDPSRREISCNKYSYVSRDLAKSGLEINFLFTPSKFDSIIRMWMVKKKVLAE